MAENVDYRSLFSEGLLPETLEFSRNLQMSRGEVPSDAPSSFTEWLKDDNNRRMVIAALGQMGASVSEKGSLGEAMGNVASRMATAGAQNVASAQMSGTQPITPKAPGGNLQDLSKQYSDASRVFKTLSSLNPKFFPENTADRVKEAFSASPDLGATNPTVPTIGSFSEQPVVGAGPVAQEFSQAALPSSVAMTLSPEQVAATYTHGLGVRRQGLEERKQTFAEGQAPIDNAYKQALAEGARADAAWKNWEMSPAGQAFKLKYAGEPARAQAAILQEREAADRAQLETIIKGNNLDNVKPEWLPAGIPSVGAFLRFSMTAKEGAKDVASMFNSMNDYKAAIEIARTRQKEIAENRATRETADTVRQLEAAEKILMQLKGKSKRTDFPNDSAGEAAFKNAQVLGTAMTPSDEILLKDVHSRRKGLMEKLGMPFTELPVIGDIGNRIVVTKEELEADAERRKNTGKRVDTLPSLNPKLHLTNPTLPMNEFDLMFSS